MRRSLGALTGGLAELAWAGGHLLTYPLGVLPQALPVDSGDGSTPVLLVHGLTDNRSMFMVMERALRRGGFTRVCTWNYSPLLRDVHSGAADLGRHVDRVLAHTGHRRVRVVGHSLGGLLARYHAQCQGGDGKIEALVTLGSPHRGTVLAHLLPTALGRQLRPGSSVMRQLAEPAPGCRTSITAVYSDLDEVILPTRSGRCEHPDIDRANVLVHGVGHVCLPVHRAVLGAVAAGLGAPAAGLPPRVAPRVASSMEDPRPAERHPGQRLGRAASA